jgi:hypothetical protein
MTTKCANPACDQPFHYFRSGKIYLIDMASAGGAVRSNDARGMEYFWLCGDCSRNMRVTLDGYGAVQVERVVAPPSIGVAKMEVHNISETTSGRAGVGSRSA